MPRNKEAKASITHMEGALDCIPVPDVAVSSNHIDQTIARLIAQRSPETASPWTGLGLPVADGQKATLRNCFKNGSRPRKPLENRHFAWFLKQSLSRYYSVKLRKSFSDNGLWIATRDRILAIACIKRDASPYHAKCCNSR